MEWWARYSLLWLYVTKFYRFQILTRIASHPKLEILFATRIHSIVLASQETIIQIVDKRFKLFIDMSTLKCYQCCNAFRMWNKNSYSVNDNKKVNKTNHRMHFLFVHVYLHVYIIGPSNDYDFDSQDYYIHFSIILKLHLRLHNVIWYEHWCT